MATPPGVTLDASGNPQGSYTYQTGTDENGNPIYGTYNYGSSSGSPTGGSQTFSNQAPPAPPMPPTTGPGGFGVQSPGIFGTGQYFYSNPNAINDQAITGNPAQGASTNYGLNDVWSQMQGEIDRAGGQGAKMAVAPQGTATTGTAAQGTAAQGAAAYGNAAHYQAALGNAAQAGQVGISTAGDASFQGQQQQLANVLGRQAAGGGVSPADLQLAQGTQNNIASQLAVLGSQRGGGGNAALAARSAADQGAAANANLAQQFGIQRAQETLNAQQALGGVLGTARGQAQNFNLNQAQFAQQTDLANMGAQNQFGMANLAAVNAANQGNAGLSQQMGMENVGNAQAMALANLNAQNQFGLTNLGNAQQTGLANLGYQNQFGLANLGLQGQYGLANQQAQLSNAQLYDQELNAMLGGQTGIAQGNRAASLADQQLQLQQALGANQINEQGFQSAAQANANLAGGIIGGISGLGSGLYNAFSGGSGGGSASGGGSGGGDTSGGFAPTYDPGTVDTPPTGNTFFSDRRLKTDIRDADDTTEKALRARTEPDYARSPHARNIRNVMGYLDVDPYAISDENLKTGITGGNPMLDSYLRQYHDATKDPDKIDVAEGLSFRGPSSTPGPTGMAGGTSLGKTLGTAGGSAAGGAAGAAAGAAIGSVVPVIGNAIGGIIGGVIGSTAGGAAGGALGGLLDSKGHPVQGAGGYNPGTGTTTEGDVAAITDDDTSAVSDDREKEAIMSGNRGMQSFLEQANAQQGAQANQGAYSNAFMQQGQPPSAQMDRQLPPWMGGDASSYGYGAPPSGGGVYGGGISDYGGFSGASLAGAGGVVSGPSVSGGGGQGGGTTYTPWSGGNVFQNAGVTPGARQSPAGFQQMQAPQSSISGNFPGQVTTSPVAAPPPGSGLHMASGLQGFRGLAMSDEREKDVDSEDPKAIGDMLDRLHAYEYRYKDPTLPGTSPGRHLGVMAQDLQKSPLGASFVEPDEEGRLRVNYGQMASTQMAALAMLNEKTNEHEQLLRALGAHRPAGERMAG